MSAVLVGTVGLAVALAAYGLAIPRVYAWGFTPLGWDSIAAAIALLGLFLFGWTPLIPAYYLGMRTAEAVVENDQAQTQEKLKGITSRQDRLEEQINDKDESGISTILQLSRLELEKWHTLTLKQNQRSFRYAVLAMWAGFVILSVGLASSFGVAGFTSNSATLLDINAVVLASGAIVEFVSGLFLWIYKSSQKQFRYFYDRQMAGYGILMAYRVAATMNRADDSKLLVVHSLLSSASTLNPAMVPPGAAPQTGGSATPS